MGETPREIASNFGDRILLAQVKDARRSAEQDSGWQLVLLGEGEVDVRSMLAELLACHYDGWVSVEWEKHWHPEIEEPEIALPQHIATLQRYLDEINPGEDAPGAGTTTSEER
jgi:sugar phosphate isomerase/epimerase